MSVQVAEFIGIGHPDKIADTIADRLLEVVLEKDLDAQFACEVLTSHNLIVVAGEISGRLEGNLDVISVVKEVLVGLEYNFEKFRITTDIQEQSTDIRLTSVKGVRGIVSGDQSVVVGYACRDTANYLPLAFEVSRSLIDTLKECIVEGSIEGAKYDCKSLVVLDGREVLQLILSIQHVEVDLNSFRREVFEKVVSPVVRRYGLCLDEGSVLINSSEKFVIGGLDADTGMTNRKLMVDSYGTVARHGGGGYSGKDLTKVDRLGAYYARWICKNLVAARICDSIELELVFYYGSSQPLVYIRECDSNYNEDYLINCIRKVFDFSFEQVYRMFNLEGIKYSELARNGHFGNPDMPWEDVGKVGEIQRYCSEN